MTPLRVLLLSELALVLVYMGLGLAGDPWLSADLRQQGDDAFDMDGARHPILFAVCGLGSLFLWFAAWILLWGGHRWGRRIYVSAILLAVPVLLASSYEISSGPLLLLDWVSSGITGAILTLLFLPRASVVLARHGANGG